MNAVIKFIEENLIKTIRFNDKNQDTLLGLPYPYTVPSVDTMFQEMYYWDTYFTNVGLIISGNVKQAQHNVNNMMYLIETYGYMPNGNRIYYLNRSQPPFLFLMVRDIFQQERDEEWLKKAYKSLEIEYSFWQNHRVAPNGLNVYGNSQKIKEQDLLVLNKEYVARTGVPTADTVEDMTEYAHAMLAFSESGWDCTSRFELEGHHYNPVDLNSLLYGFERYMQEISGVLANGKEVLWKERADLRKKKMDEYLWNSDKQLYMDWNFCEGHFSPILSAASLYPLFFQICDSIKGEEDLLDKLLLNYGVSATESIGIETNYQWDYPNVWAPLQYIACIGCQNYGRLDVAKKIASRYTLLIENGFDDTGNLWEKYDGNTGRVSSQDYTAPTMMGWTAGTYLYFKNYLDEIAAGSDGNHERIKR